MSFAQQTTSLAKARNSLQESLNSLAQGNDMIPDQLGQKSVMNRIIEHRNFQNQVKNKLRKVLFEADKGK